MGGAARQERNSKSQHKQKQPDQGNVAASGAVLSWSHGNKEADDDAHGLVKPTRALQQAGASPSPAASCAIILEAGAYRAMYEKRNAQVSVCPHVPGCMRLEGRAQRPGGRIQAGCTGQPGVRTWPLSRQPDPATPDLWTNPLPPWPRRPIPRLRPRCAR